ncbi:hypothetical protein, partial [Mesorhizobium sp.]|uniref:hypothetical protein n=1 Tax=Mesorhizobium sp. TaxID=1871066 RepID=UPI0025C62066
PNGLRCSHFCFPLPRFFRTEKRQLFCSGLWIFGLDTGLWIMGLIPGLNPWLIQAQNSVTLPKAWATGPQHAFEARAHGPAISCCCLANSEQNRNKNVKASTADGAAIDLCRHRLPDAEAFKEAGWQPAGV